MAEGMWWRPPHPALATKPSWAKMTLKEGKEPILVTQEATSEQAALYPGKHFSSFCFAKLINS